MTRLIVRLAALSLLSACAHTSSSETPTDRILVAEGKPQRYGTQFHTVDGKLVPRPIEDEANVDARRAAVGLGTMAEYNEQMQRMASGGAR
jgi:hypothetical protein